VFTLALARHLVPLLHFLGVLTRSSPKLANALNTTLLERNEHVKADVEDDLSQQEPAYHVLHLSVVLIHHQEHREDDALVNQELVQDLGPLNLAVTKWLCQRKVQEVKESDREERGDLHARIRVPEDGNQDEHNPSNQEHQVVHHG